MGGMEFLGCVIAVVGADITKCDTLSWFDLTRLCTTVMVSNQE